MIPSPPKAPEVPSHSVDPTQSETESHSAVETSHPAPTDNMNARSFANVLEATKDSIAEVNIPDIPSDVNKLIEESIDNMSDNTPDISPLLSPAKTIPQKSCNKGMKYHKPQPDQSLILQGKRTRKATEKFVATTAKKNSSSDSETDVETTSSTTEPRDKYSKWLAKEEAKKQAKREQQRKRAALTAGKSSSSSKK